MNSNASWELKIDEIVYKQLKKIPRKYAEKIIGILESPFFNPHSGDVKKIKGEKITWRRRIGSYRIFYDVRQKEKMIHIFWIERKTTKTYQD